MKEVVLFGAGKSATVLIQYLLEQAAVYRWKIIVVDHDLLLAREKVKDSPYGEALSFDIHDSTQRKGLIAAASLVISMLPPSLHAIVADDCLVYAKHLLTASYVDQNIREKEKEIAEKKILFLCEMGLDPGIDHMSAMDLVHRIHRLGGRVSSFRSHCGGLVAPESDTNPWHYKISWNPRNIIMAGKAGAHFLSKGKEVKLPYAQLFANTATVTVPQAGEYGWYANRDSMSYISLYALEGVETFVRTTLRHPAFMQGWKQVIQLQLTDETPAYDTNSKSIQAVLTEHITKKGLETTWAGIEKDEQLRQQFAYLGFFDKETQVNKGLCSAADLLQWVAEKNLGLAATDKDMIVLQHEIAYTLNGVQKQINSSLVVKGDDAVVTAMAKTVGLPLGIAARLVLTEQLTITGLHIPVIPAIYEPVLEELATRGIKFREEQ